MFEGNDKEPSCERIKLKFSGEKIRRSSSTIWRQSGVGGWIDMPTSHCGADAS